MRVTAYMVAAAKAIHPDIPTELVRKMVEAAVAAQTSAPFSDSVHYSKRAEMQLDHLNDVQWRQFAACMEAILNQSSATDNLDVRSFGSNGLLAVEIGQDHLLIYAKTGDVITVQDVLEKEQLARWQQQI